MRVDFYQLSRDSVEVALPPLARKVIESGERLLVVSVDPARRAGLSEALWAVKDSFLANGEAGAGHEARQPILLSVDPDPLNGARFIALADGEWRDEALGFDRVFLLFGATTIEAARATWRMLGERDDAERRFWKQEGGRWVEGP